MGPVSAVLVATIVDFNLVAEVAPPRPPPWPPVPETMFPATVAPTSDDATAFPT